MHCERYDVSSTTLIRRDDRWADGGFPALADGAQRGQGGVGGDYGLQVGDHLVVGVEALVELGLGREALLADELDLIGVQLQVAQQRAALLGVHIEEIVLIDPPHRVVEGGDQLLHRVLDLDSVLSRFPRALGALCFDTALRAAGTM